MAFDIDVALATGYKLENDLNELQSILRVYKDAKVSVRELGDIPFTSAQLSLLKNRYLALKANLQANFVLLP